MHSSVEMDQPLSRHAVDLLRTSVARCRNGALDDGARAAVRKSMTQLCADARSRNLPATRVLIALKATWHTLPEVREMSRTESAELLSKVVQICIEEYYRFDGDGLTSDGPTGES